MKKFGKLPRVKEVKGGRALYILDKSIEDVLYSFNKDAAGKNFLAKVRQCIPRDFHIYM